MGSRAKLKSCAWPWVQPAAGAELCLEHSQSRAERLDHTPDGKGKVLLITVC